MGLYVPRSWKGALLVPAVLLPATALGGLALGSRLDDSVVVDVTTAGLASLEGLAGVFLPPRIELPPFQQNDSASVFGVTTYAYDIAVEGLYADIAIGDLSLVPATGALNLVADAVVTVNSPGDAAVLDIFAELFGLDVIDDTCDLYVNPINLDLSAVIGMELVVDPAGIDVDGDGTPDTKRLDVTIPPATWSWDAQGEDIQFTNCGLADVINTVNDVTNFFGFNLYDLILDLVEPQIDTAINDLPATLEPLLEDTFASLTISQEIDLLGEPLALTLWPESLQLQADGMRIGLASVTDVKMAPCVAKYGITESASTASPLPAIGVTPAGIPFPAHAVALIDDDFVNQVLFGVWSSGVLCLDLANTDVIDLPIPIDTGLLNALSDDAFVDLFPVTSPLALVLAPRKPPVMVKEGPNDVNVRLDELGVGMFVEIDGRRTRLVNLDLAADAGIDLPFDTATGTLALAVNLPPGAIVPTVTYNEFAPEANEDIEEGFGGIIDSVVGILLGDLLGGLSFPIPSFEGIGVTDLAVAAAGPNGDHVGAFVSTGVVTYPSAGCDESGGCTSGCDSGCSTGSGSGRLVLLLMPLVVAVLRRRR